MFNLCTSLKSIDIPSTVKSISYSAFSGCSALTDITIPPSVETIEQYAFVGCSALTTITIPSSVKTIEGKAFMDCSTLKDVFLSEGIERIEWLAFYRTGITNITIPTSVSYIGSCAFGGGNLQQAFFCDTHSWSKYELTTDPWIDVPPSDLGDPIKAAELLVEELSSNHGYAFQKR